MKRILPNSRFVVHLLFLMATVSLFVAAPTAGSAPAPTQLEIVSLAQRPSQSTPELINQALANGEITAEQRLLYLAYAVYEYRSLPARFHSNVGWYGTAYVQELRRAWQAAALKRELLSLAVYNELARLLAPAAATICDKEDGPNNDNTSANFYINYGTITGSPLLTVADYRNALDAAYAVEVASYDWAKPPACSSCGGAPLEGRYPVQIASLGGGLYGYVTGSGGSYTQEVGDNPNTTAVETAATASCMVLRDDSYASLGGLNGLKVTAAHEFVHSIQNGYGDPGWDEDTMWWEGHAAYTEDEVLDASNDNYQYLWPDWTQCLGQWPGESAEYSTWLLFRYAAEHNGGANVAGGGEDIAQQLWANIAAGQKGLAAYNAALGTKTPGATLADTFHKYAIASRFEKSCPNSDPYCYKEAAGYVASKGEPTDHASITEVPGSYDGSIRDYYAINWVALPTSGGPYNVTLSNTSSGGQLRGSVVADPTGDRTGALNVQGLPAVVNPGESWSLCYTPPAGANRVAAVITNQAQTEGNPSTCTLNTYSLALAAAAATGSATNLPTGVTVDVGCGAYVKVKRNSGDPGTVTATKHTSAPGGNPAGAGEMPLWWGITGTGSSYNVDLTLCYTDAELAAAGAGVTESGLVLFRNTGGPTWTEVGADARDTGVNCVTKNGVTAFSNWTLGMPGQPNAISLRGFAARPSGTSISLATLISAALLGLALVVRNGRR